MATSLKALCEAVWQTAHNTSADRGLGTFSENNEMLNKQDERTLLSFYT